MLTKILDVYERSKKGYDPIIDGWFLYGSPLGILSVIAAYVVIVKWLGPRHMKDRKPYNLVWIIRLYNVCQIAHNLFMIFRAFYEPHYARHLFFFGCVTLQEPAHSIYRYATFTGFWHYFMNKLGDLLDTMFFVFRKKQSHVTVLHLFHHISMVLVVWYIGKYLPGQEAAMACLINLHIHVLMYSYYLLSSFGDRFSWIYKYKEVLTLLQIGQFLVIFVYNTLAFYVSCYVHYSVVKLVTLEAFLNLLLFLNFYYRTYGKNRLTQMGAMTFCNLQLASVMKESNNNNNVESTDAEKIKTN